MKLTTGTLLLWWLLINGLLLFYAFCPLRPSFSKPSCKPAASSRLYNIRTELSIEAAFALKGRSLTASVSAPKGKRGPGFQDSHRTNQRRTLLPRTDVCDWPTGEDRAKSRPQDGISERQVLLWIRKKKNLVWRFKNMNYDYSNILYLWARFHGLTNYVGI